MEETLERVMAIIERAYYLGANATDPDTSYTMLIDNGWRDCMDMLQDQLEEALEGI